MKRRGFGRRLSVLLGAFAALIASLPLASTAGAADRVYWANAGGPPASEISFANLDGSGGADLSTSSAPVVP